MYLRMRAEQHKNQVSLCAQLLQNHLCGTTVIFAEGSLATA